ncbi:MAG: hypothetical protein WCO51_11175, partial [bacterium]
VQSIALPKGDSLTVTFELPACGKNKFLCFGGWFVCDGKLKVSIKNCPSSYTLTEYHPPNWNKFGSLWRTDGAQDSNRVTACFKAETELCIAFYGLACGIVQHQHLNDAREALLPNIYQISPEANFIVTQGKVMKSNVNNSTRSSGDHPFNITLKSCNRCARFLPINTEDERDHLSFSNHCVAEHRRPCCHTGFGLLRNSETNETLKLDYGFQLECRFCKKFEVNAAHNPMRTPAQMKEDAARRRGFELLIESLYGGTPQLRYREQTGRELANDIFEKFSRRCFKCDKEFGNQREMNLDHTRPLALLWPLDGTATALCGDCNSLKRDHLPAKVYTSKQISDLSALTGLTVKELLHVTPNMEAIEMIVLKKDWFFDEFLMKEEMTKNRDGKVTGELLVKALQKVFEKCKGGAPLNLQKLYDSKRKQ